VVLVEEQKWIFVSQKEVTR